MPKSTKTAAAPTAVDPALLAAIMAAMQAMPKPDAAAEPEEKPKAKPKAKAKAAKEYTFEPQFWAGRWVLPRGGICLDSWPQVRAKMDEWYADPGRTWKVYEPKE